VLALAESSFGLVCICGWCLLDGEADWPASKELGRAIDGDGRLLMPITNIHSAKMFAPSRPRAVLSEEGIEHTVRTFRRGKRLFFDHGYGVWLFLNGFFENLCPGSAGRLWAVERRFNFQRGYRYGRADCADALRLNAIRAGIMWSVSTFFRALGGCVPKGWRRISAPIKAGRCTGRQDARDARRAGSRCEVLSASLWAQLWAG